ncbi:sensor histidine kinase [Mucilaginibacter flavidus]|uniref:sensor histidine kinase n=1 Tax=Mucilaginibacter flavidus TaxID=2949309 RepID=UPI002091F17A|nr:HAMP domain-containing sensor histidine kinase [Mucilaginibacter flavidus]MCO5949325.1 HAMP domain-containing histidine kinase [Mucilaginibacter flavidus]
MNRKDEFMSIASHELKTPITSVKASLQLIDKMVGKHPQLESVAPFISKASKQVNKLTNIINDLLDVTKIQAGKLQLNESFFNLYQLIVDSVEQCQLIDNRHKILIKGNNELKIYADRDRIEQVFCNLINNAIKYSPKAEEVHVGFEILDDQITVSVTDFGIGIPAEKVANIFDRFFRVEHTSKNFSGLGLGLYISSEIIKQHNGEIGVISETDKGSTFWFTVKLIVNNIVTT